MDKTEFYKLLNTQQHELYKLLNIQQLNCWKSPEKEQSVFSGIPILHLNSVKEVISDALKDSEFTYNVRFQGPRFGAHKMATKKEDATHFRVYIKKKPAKVPKRLPAEFVFLDGYKYKMVK